MFVCKCVCVCLCFLWIPNPIESVLWFNGVEVAWFMYLLLPASIRTVDNVAGEAAIQLAGMEGYLDFQHMLTSTDTHTKTHTHRHTYTTLENSSHP